MKFRISLISTQSFNVDVENYRKLRNRGISEKEIIKQCVYRYMDIMEGSDVRDLEIETEIQYSQI